MELKDYQMVLFNRLISYDKSLVFWARQTGKSLVVTKYIENFINNENNKNILFIINHKKYITTSKVRILHEIGQSIIDKHRTDDIFFINNNFLKFVAINNMNIEYILSTLAPELIIYDEFRIDNPDKLFSIRKFIEISKCKCIFTSTFLDIELVHYLDINNDYYINIMPPTLTIHNNQFSFSNMDDPNINNRLIIKELGYKPDELLDYSDTIFQRKRKLKKLNKISNGS
jgi:hypothetical protein